MNSRIDELNIKLHPPTFEPWKSSENHDKDIIVLMSGGVDSSVTALLLKKAGWNVLGITMKMPVAERCDYQRSCCGLEVGYVCKDLGIKHYYIDVREAFEQLVIEPFRQSYLEGRTPSPCVDCNTVFKFGLVWDFLENEFGISNLATGHYARVIHKDSQSYLSVAVDKNRDQSYFLYGIPRERLPSLVLPLGDLTKPEVRDLAKNEKLPVARRPDSMELCFAGEGDYRNALGSESGEEGPILDMQGNVLGRHNGIANYTVGQRRGIGIAAREPLYVVSINAADNSITVGTMEETRRDVIETHKINVLVPENVQPGARLFGKIRSQGDPSACSVVEVDESKLKVRFEVPQFAPTPGQHLVLYDEQEIVIAGGTIC